MNNQMTPQEALNVLGGMETLFRKGKPVEASNIALVATMMAQDALRSNIPHVISLDEARALEPHTPVWVEAHTPWGKSGVDQLMPCFEVYSILNWFREWEQDPFHAKNERVWVGGWPSPELRAATPWPEP